MASALALWSASKEELQKRSERQIKLNDTEVTQLLLADGCTCKAAGTTDAAKTYLGRTFYRLFSR